VAAGRISFRPIITLALGKDMMNFVKYTPNVQNNGMYVIYIVLFGEV